MCDATEKINRLGEYDHQIADVSNDFNHDDTPLEITNDAKARELSNFKQNYLKKLKYQDNITYGLDYLFNEEDYYKPTEVKSAFDGSYMLYESRGDKDAKLTL